MNILIVSDVQNGFMTFPKCKEVGNKIVELLNEGKADKVIALKYSNYKKSPFVQFLGYDKMMSDEEVELLGGIKADVVWDKSTYSPVSRDFINLLVKLNNGKLPNEVYLCGFDTDACVLATALNLFEIGIKPIVLKDYCYSSGGKAIHQNALKILERNIGEENVV